MPTLGTKLRLGSFLLKKDAGNSPPDCCFGMTILCLHGKIGNANIKPQPKGWGFFLLSTSAGYAWTEGKSFACTVREKIAAIESGELVYDIDLAGNYFMTC